MAYLPGFGQVYDATTFEQSNPLEKNYSPRLFGSPPQLSSLCDMRIDSSHDGVEGATGDWYRNNVLKKAQVINFFVGRALFTGGYNNGANILRQLKSYQIALSRYDIFGNTEEQQVSDRNKIGEAVKYTESIINTLNKTSTESTPSETSTMASTNTTTETTSDTNSTTATGTGSSSEAISDLSSITSSDSSDFITTMIESDTGNSSRSIPITTLEVLQRQGKLNADYLGIEANTQILDIGQVEQADAIDTSIQSIGNNFGKAAASIIAPLKASLSINQPFYTFEADWYTYINNVKMMINTAVIMLGLQQAKVRIGDYLYPIGMDVSYNKDTDVWTNYRYITPDEGVGAATSIDNVAGETNQYVSFMIDSVSESESYSNSTSDSKIYSTMQSGNDLGNEIAFITNSSSNVVDDAVISLAGSAIGAAEKVLDTLSFGAGKFTAAVAGGFARSYLGDHPIYPKIFQSHTSTSQMTVSVKLRASRGDPYTYLIDVLVPLFHILGMVLPKMSQYSAGAYQYPPIIQCQIPGVWGTQLGIIQSVSVTKNPDGNGLSANGYPMSINVSITIEDLCHCMVTTGMDKAAYFLNNKTMFDYIAQCTGVDKYRSNSAARLVTRLALAASYAENAFYNIGQAVANDFTTLVNKHTRIAQQ